MKKRIIALFFAAAFIAAAFCGCAVKNEYASDSGMYYEPEGNYYKGDGYSYASKDEYKDAPAEYDYGDSISEDASALSALIADSALQSSRKIILTANMSIETKEYADSLETLRGMVESLGGYISGANSYIYDTAYSLRRGVYTVRIPAENFSSFISVSEDIGNITNLEVSQDDITNRYTDIETRLETLRTKRDRLLALMEKAEEMYDIIELENALSDTVYEIESLTGSKNVYDDLLSYSTAYVNIKEVRDLTQIVTAPRTLGQRISQAFQSAVNGFTGFCEDLLVFIVSAFPWLILIAVVIFLIVFITRKTAPRRLAKRMERLEKSRETAEEFRARRAARLKKAAEEAKKTGE